MAEIYRPNDVQEFQNIRGYVTRLNNGLKIEIRAEVYMEPHSNFLFVLNNSEEEVNYSAEEGQYQSGFTRDVHLSDGTRANAIGLGRFPATSPGFPFVVNITKKTERPVELICLMRAVSKNNYVVFPHIEV